MTSLHADEAFLEHYHFSHDPFAARVPGFKFFPAQRKPVLGQLHHLARYSQLLLVVSGPLGSGKTLLRQALVASTNKQAVHCVVVSARGAVEPDAVLRQIAQGLQVQQVELTAILRQVGQMALTGQEVYVLVDDAEHLGDAALAALLALAGGDGEGRAHVFLFAEPQLVGRLESLADGEECFHALALQPYAEDETREYLAQRLEGAGQGLELLSDEQVQDVHRRSAGWPGAINEVAREVLIEAMLAQRGSGRRGGLSLRLPRKHLAALLVVGAGVLAAWLMQGRSASDGGMSATAQLPLGQVAPSAGEASPQPVVEPASGGAPAIEFAGASQPLPLPLVGEAQPVIRQPLAEAAGGGSIEEGEESLGNGGAVAEVASAVAPAIPPVEVAAVVSEAPVAPQAQVAAPAPAPAPQVASVAPGKVAGQAEWYAAQGASHYTLQILGARAESSAQAFVRQHGGAYRYFKKLHQGQPLYVVTYGSFASREAAQAALRTLPAKVQAGKPWPRTFASIKQDIAQAR